MPKPDARWLGSLKAFLRKVLALPDADPGSSVRQRHQQHAVIGLVHLHGQI
jgi:hypothetical protein